MWRDAGKQPHLYCGCGDSPSNYRHRRNYKTHAPGRSNYDHVDDKSPSKTTWEMVRPAAVIGDMLSRPLIACYVGYPQHPACHPWCPRPADVRARLMCTLPRKGSDCTGGMMLPADLLKLSSCQICAVQVLQSQGAGASKPADDDGTTKFKQMDNDGAQQLSCIRSRLPSRHCTHWAPCTFAAPTFASAACAGDGFIDAKDLRSFLGPAANVDKLITQARPHRSCVANIAMWLACKSRCSIHGAFIAAVRTGRQEQGRTHRLQRVHEPVEIQHDETRHVMTSLSMSAYVMALAAAHILSRAVFPSVLAWQACSCPQIQLVRPAPVIVLLPHLVLSYSIPSRGNHFVTNGDVKTRSARYARVQRENPDCLSCD